MFGPLSQQPRHLSPNRVLISGARSCIIPIIKHWAFSSVNRYRHRFCGGGEVASLVFLPWFLVAFLPWCSFLGSWSRPSSVLGGDVPSVVRGGVPSVVLGDGVGVPSSR